MSSFCNAKATHFFSAKNIGVFAIFQDRNFNFTLANSLLSFELGPDHYLISPWQHILLLFISSNEFTDNIHVCFHGESSAWMINKSSTNPLIV